MRRLLLFCLLVFVSFSCSSKAEKQSESANSDSTQTEQTSENEEPEKYAVTTITLNGKKQKIRFKEENKELVVKIKGIIESNTKLEFYKKKLIDITGEGSLDTVEVRIDKVGKNDFRITNSIYTHGKFAWRDTVSVLATHEEYMFEEIWRKDSAYYKLLPYSNYLEALDYIDFVSEDFDYKLWKEQDEIAQGLLQRYLGRKNLLNQFTPKSGRFIDIFENYIGGTIISLSLSNPDGYIWFEPTLEFIELHSP